MQSISPQEESVMYGEVQGSAVVPVVATAGAVAVLPHTGANTLMTIAGAVAVGLVAWGVVYYYKVVRG